MTKMKRVVLIVLDGVGCGAQADADKYGDVGANTLKHVYEQGKPEIPNLRELGLLCAAGIVPAEEEEPVGCYGRMTERAAGKDTTTGHWEIAGLTLNKPFPTYPNGFPEELIKQFEEAVGLETIGNKPASGTAIIEELGAEHLRTCKLIVYTSADSVFQVAAHEAIVPPAELWHYCRIARRLLKGEHAVGRVIARPFIGEVGAFQRTANRRDFSVDPSGNTLLDVLKAEGYDVLGVGKIEDIFNHRGLTGSNHAAGNDACVDAILEYLKKDNWKGLLFANLVDTDMLFGHRNDVRGFAKALEAFDRRLPEILKLLGDDGMVIITADHGCDPAFPSTDHTREQVPVLAWGLGLQEGVALGERATFADVSATVLEALGARGKLDGRSFYKDIALG
ncbi:MAG: phosphopentomutase [Clostridiales bacterium]|jgi:phosphopentomutase|nr:phosphopentomutase [Clostridiales bacterium]OPZ66956.1 MAG: Phosphopentomutase [Firmicutes bacterium ADurb.Bin467]